MDNDQLGSMAWIAFKKQILELLDDSIIEVQEGQDQPQIHAIFIQNLRTTFRQKMERFLEDGS